MNAVEGGILSPHLARRPGRGIYRVGLDVDANKSSVHLEPHRGICRISVCISDSNALITRTSQSTRDDTDPGTCQHHGTVAKSGNYSLKTTPFWCNHNPLTTLGGLPGQQSEGLASLPASLKTSPGRHTLQKAFRKQSGFDRGRVRL